MENQLKDYIALSVERATLSASYQRYESYWWDATKGDNENYWSEQMYGITQEIQRINDEIKKLKWRNNNAV